MADALHLEEIVAYIRTRVTFNVGLAVICGSGLSGLTDIIQNPVSVPFEDIPYFPRSTVAGHGSELVFGNLHGHKIVAAKGRFHYYEGNSPAVVGLQVRLFAALGAKVLIVTNAAGGINKTFKVGDVMLIRDHVSFLGLAGIHPLVGHNDARFGPRFPAQGAAVYTPGLQVPGGERGQGRRDLASQPPPSPSSNAGHSPGGCGRDGPLWGPARGRLHGRLRADVRVARGGPRPPHPRRRRGWVPVLGSRGGGWHCHPRF